VEGVTLQHYIEDLHFSPMLYPIDLEPLEAPKLTYSCPRWLSFT